MAGFCPIISLQSWNVCIDNRDSIPSKSRDFFFAMTFRMAPGPQNLIFSECWGNLSSRINWLEREAARSRLSTGVVRMREVIPPFSIIFS
jgi:hypothetical protein